MHSDAGTYRANAVSRDHLMNGASLKYSGDYDIGLLYNVGVGGFWWSSTILSGNSSRLLGTTNFDAINPQVGSNKNVGRTVRYSQISIFYIQRRATPLSLLPVFALIRREPYIYRS
ncbi:hypothetical protein IKE88_03485 [Candidatus Saccharibacteria bacterium]|nr:hypothetical protein [Candidatus Saccharibacteria bacterium]